MNYLRRGRALKLIEEGATLIQQCAVVCSAFVQLNGNFSRPIHSQIIESVKCTRCCDRLLFVDNNNLGIVAMFGRKMISSRVTLSDGV